MIGHPYDIAQITSGSFSTVTNLPTYHAVNPLTDLPDDVEEFGEIDSFQALGVTSMAFPADKDGFAEGVILRDCGNTDGVLIGARDKRCAEVYGAMRDGDTVLHSVDPKAAAQVQCKASRQVSLFTKDTNGGNIMVNVDGKNNKIQISGWGGLIEMSKDGGIFIGAPDGKSSIQMKDGSIVLVGTIMLGGIVPIASLASWVSLGSPSVPGVTAFKPAPNVFVGG